MAVLVKDYMTVSPHTIGADRTVDLALDVMAEHKCHHLPVLKGGHLIGVLSDRDLELLKASKKTEELKIEDVMNFEPFVVDPDTPVAKLAGDLIEQNIGSAIVRATDSNKWGIFTVTDALKIIRDHVQ